MNPYSISGNGYISTDVLKEILRELDNKLTEEDLDNIVDEVDEDSSGTLDFDGKTIVFVAKKIPSSRSSFATHGIANQVDFITRAPVQYHF